jgi:hypothetical protein
MTVPLVPKNMPACGQICHSAGASRNIRVLRGVGQVRSGCDGEQGLDCAAMGATLDRMIIVTHDTLLNPSALEMRTLPRRFFGRVTLWPRRAGLWLWVRIMFEVELWRYLLALLPFVLGALIWQEYAIAIAQAPLPMFMLLYLVEARFLRVPKEKRAGLIDAADADRGLDLLRARGVSLLTRIAAGRGLGSGALHLVVEQSDMARVAPLTYVSVQSEDGPQVLRLNAAERAMIGAELFQPPLTEHQLRLINLRDDQPLRDVALEAGRVSAHARMAALMRKSPLPLAEKPERLMHDGPTQTGLPREG